jgi:uncharacterized repeat protein (TIGR03803 family)
MKSNSWRIVALAFMSAMMQACAAPGAAPQIAPASVAELSHHARTANYEYQTLFSFHGYDGAGPAGAMIYYHGKLYGTTEYGGAYTEGTVFTLTPAGAETVIHSFGAPYDGSEPHARLTVFNGVLYGTTYNGGAYGGGTVFSITTDGRERVIYSFGQSAEAPANPSAGLTVLNGALYGTTSAGGYYSEGTVYAITVSGQLTVLHKFVNGGYKKKDGANPLCDLTAWNGILYGTTEYGGVNLGGIFFSVTISGTERVLYSFPARRYDGESPEAGLILFNGRLYGTTSGGGAGFDDAGTIYSMTAKGREHEIFNFQPFKEYGYGADTELVPESGMFYGTMPQDGGNGDGSGTVYAVSPSGSAATVVHVFGSPPDGAKPLTGLTDVRGRLYGTTSIGGGVSDSGTVYKITVK